VVAVADGYGPGAAGRDAGGVAAPGEARALVAAVAAAVAAVEAK
jgi:hypothetical protein